MVQADKRGGLAFRYDDNQPLAKWRAMAEVFDKYGYPMSLALIATGDNAFNAETLAFLKEEAAKGHELMDHTPAHSAFFFSCSDAQKYTNEPWVDHIRGNKVYCKYKMREDAPPSIRHITFKAKVQGNHIDLPDEVKKFYWPGSNHVIINGKAYILMGRSENEFILEDFWSEPIDLGDLGEVECQTANKSFDFYAELGALKEMARLVQEHRKKLGLPPATAWIQPGSRVAIVQADNVRDAYAEFGYVSAATYQNSAALTFCEPDPERCAYAMMWGQINLERTPSLEELKKAVADAVATHRVLIASSHIRTNAFPNGLDGYVRLHDELLKWCKEKGVMVKTQSEWARLLYFTKTDPQENVFPSLTVDLNEDGNPDGFERIEGVTCANGILSRQGRGKLFQTLPLGGVEHGKNTLKLDIEGGKPCVNIYFWNRGRKLGMETIKGTEGSFNVPQDAVTVVIELINEQEAPMTFRGGSLHQ